MTGDPHEEEHRRRVLHEYERHIARQPGTGPGRPDPIHVLRVRLRDQPEAEAYLLARWSIIARAIRDAQAHGDELTDLGPDAMLIAQAAQRGEWRIGEMAVVGVASDGRWLSWNPPGFPVEPVPGSPGERARRN